MADGAHVTSDEDQVRIGINGNCGRSTNVY